MAGRSPREAFESFIAPFRTAVTFVVPRGRGVIVSYRSPLQPETEQGVTFANGDPVRLAGVGLSLKLIHNVRVVEVRGERLPYRVVTTDYWFSLLDVNGRELVTYHYHPSASGWCRYPHLHAETATGIISGNAHLVTALVPFPAFIRMLIEDPAIPVVSLRPDWSRLLELKGDPVVVK